MINIANLTRYDALIDWMSIRFNFTLETRDEFIKKIGLGNVIPEYIEKGMMGYKQTIIFGEKIKLYTNPHDPLMGELLVLSGRACREYELLNLDWQNFFNQVRDYYGVFTRIDLALDIFNDNTITLPKVRSKILQGHLTSFSRKAIRMTTHDLNNGSVKGETIYLGTPQSKQRIVFYDKLHERIRAGYEIDDSIKTWFRIELQLKKEKAQQAGYNVGENVYLIPEILLNYLYTLVDFKVESKTQTTNKSYWKTVNWWSTLVQSSNKIIIASKAYQSTITSKKDWLVRSVTSTLVQLSYSYDHLNSFVEDLLDMMVNKNDEMSLNKTRTLLNNHRIRNGDSKLSFDDMIDLKNNFENVVRRFNQVLGGKDD